MIPVTTGVPDSSFTLSVEAGVPSAASAALTAFFLVSVGASVQGDLRFLVGVPVTVAGFVMTWVAARRVIAPAAAGGGAGPTLGRVAGWLSVLTAIAMLVPSAEGVARWYDVASRLYAAAAVVLVGVFASDDPKWRPRAMWAVVVAGVAMHLIAPLGVRPSIDVWAWTQTCTRALLHGVHPYTVRAPDLYRGAFDWGSTPSTYPYTPLILVVSAPFVALLGDYRFGMALALPLAIGLFRAAGRRLAVDAWLLDAMTLGMVLYPRGLLITALGFTEPLLVLTLSIYLWLAVARPKGNAQAIAFFLLPAIKQYVAAPVLIFAAMRRNWRETVLASACAAATVAPFLLWNREATMAGLLYLVRAPIGFRADSNSVAALIAVVVGFEMPRWVGIVAQFAVGLAAYRYLRRFGVAGLLLASALAVIASFLLATQAFANYYYFARTVLLDASLVLAGRRVATS